MILGRTTRLRTVQTSDVDHLSRWQDDPHVMREWGHASPLPSRDHLERDVRGRLSETESALCLIVETADGTPIGRIDVMGIDRRHRSAELAVYVGEVAEAGQGNGTDALTSVCRYLFEQRGLHRLGLTVMIENHRAIRVYERIGFRREGVLRHHLWVDGRPIDELAMSLLSGELRAP